MGGGCIKTLTLDAVLNQREDKVTYIKMDIEGAEGAAIDGAKKIIMEDHPKLGVCIYHKEEDLWELPYKIMKEFPDYKVYIRHHSNTTIETVCYAI